MIANVLSIAGTDPSGGAGIQADLKAFAAQGAYGMSVITAVVAQNTHGVRDIVALEPDFVAAQLAAVTDDVRVDAIKIGMVANAGIVAAIARGLDTVPEVPVVLDPVMVAKSGDHLLAQDTVAAIRDELLPRATVITPNLPEGSVLAGGAEPRDVEGMRELLQRLRGCGSEWVLLKGGHLAGEASVDLLASGHADEPCAREYAAPRIRTRNTHGTGCTLSAAIAALLPRHDVPTSVELAKRYLTGALRHADELEVGSGHGPVHHFHELWPVPAVVGA
ncbi:bifunctional hydroxymethylpyrimidine kinase/phosphomethylpyrimidine kinase [Gulosibacter sediminis]|uniref:bifunctional hydroxymethylpyrimidine kinase/phosphomethylpyrimidine kinase n=1 Tax=Gulosibacter sediminis TaxID=1729695 RepID=UPI0024AD024E|nr:bifunctional hydroxymethylpyrimidine kinase/phosphomethylpyrimidine kinase [Gulosibacter sediminis]